MHQVGTKSETCDSTFFPPRGVLGGISSLIFAGCTMAARNVTSFTTQAMDNAMILPNETHHNDVDSIDRHEGPEARMIVPLESGWDSTPNPAPRYAASHGV